MKRAVRDVHPNSSNSPPPPPKSSSNEEQEAPIPRDENIELRVNNLERELNETLCVMKSFDRDLQGIMSENTKALSANASLQQVIGTSTEMMTNLARKNKELRTVIYSLKMELSSYVDLAQRNQTYILDLEQEVARFRDIEESFSVLRTDNNIAKNEEELATQRDELNAKTLEGVILHNRWKFGKKLGSGGGGVVCEAFDLFYQQKRAAKLEVSDGSGESPLLREYGIYEKLHSENDLAGFARVHYFGPCGPFFVLILDCLGPSLFKYCQLRLSTHVVLEIGVQCLDRIRTLHQNKIVHRDIKPENILTQDDAPEGESVYLIDFGLATSCEDSTDCENSPQGNIPFIGTVLYASIAAHRGVTQAWKDDLEALGYVLVKLMNGKLPWERVGGDTIEETSQKTLQMKQSISVEQLCDGLPIEVLLFFRYVKNLSFAQIPDYDGLRFLLSTAQMQRLVDDE